MRQIKVASVARSIVINQIFMVSTVDVVGFEANYHANICTSLF